MKLVLSCEHAGNALPQQFKFIKDKKDPVWETHRAYDPGAFKLFQELSKIADFNFDYKFSRLLIEPNRSLHHRSLFSEYSKSLTEVQKKQLIDSFYLKYRNEIEQCIAKHVKAGEEVIHISVHSFTPVLHEVERQTDIGLLYDPSRKGEKIFSKHFKDELIKEWDVTVRFNYPYLGKADGFTTYLRSKFEQNYIGIELEVNQKFAKNNKFSTELMQHIKKGLLQACQLQQSPRQATISSAKF
ncbi:N-formylglutamate amidohydrolase [Zunongwangia pacifica]|uniref:N-formylglutamate amidohydrolase n=1 Tax=Zunongwangia pacifica TaxID=2911062 RepID=A0A9X1ZSN5_9FLAO|nr:N-formylglutamate amidohydrolase [Zunongwangia pacifica]